MSAFSASRLSGLLAVALLALVLSSCNRSRPEEAALLPSDFREWGTTTSVVLDYPIPGHEDRFRRIRMNEIGFGARPTETLAGRRWDFPPGTIVAKEIYANSRPAPGEQPQSITAMVKAPQDARARGGWIWVVKDLGSGKERVFEGSFCVTCHANANETHPYGDRNPKEEFRDYLFFPPSPSQERAAPISDTY